MNCFEDRGFGMFRHIDDLVHGPAVFIELANLYVALFAFAPTGKDGGFGFHRSYALFDFNFLMIP